MNEEQLHGGTLDPSPVIGFETDTLIGFETDPLIGSFEKDLSVLLIGK